MDLQERLSNIDKFKQKKDYEAKLKYEQENEEQLELVEEVKKLKPRIEAIIQVGNKCLENEIPIMPPPLFFNHDGYDKGNFVTDSVSHIVGFVVNKNQYATSKNINLELNV